jgi:hypothetical protein
MFKAVVAFRYRPTLGDEFRLEQLTERFLKRHVGQG